MHPPTLTLEDSSFYKQAETPALPPQAASGWSFICKRDTDKLEQLQGRRMKLPKAAGP